VNKTIDESSETCQLPDYIQRLRQLQGVLQYQLYSSETPPSIKEALSTLRLENDPVVTALALQDQVPSVK
jgi:hypothetical protein